MISDEGIKAFVSLEVLSMKRLLIEIFIGTPIVVGLYVLFEYLYHSFITRSNFTVNAETFFVPICTWVVLEVIMHLSRRYKENKKSDKSTENTGKTTDDEDK